LSDILKLPLPDLADYPIRIVERAIQLSREDWNDFETSWDFQSTPLLRDGIRDSKLSKSWENWKTLCESAVCEMVDLQKENIRELQAALPRINRNQRTK
jgi:hypothetical protein